jgi:hypothetical protein
LHKLASSVGVVLGRNDSEVEGSLGICVEFNKSRTGPSSSDQSHEGEGQFSCEHSQEGEGVGVSDAGSKGEKEGRAEERREVLEGERKSKRGKHPRKKREG